MKSRGVKALGHQEKEAYEKMYWIPIEELDRCPVYPMFLKSYLEAMPVGIEHVLTHERDNHSDI